jgi:ribosomal protein L37E
VAKKPLEIDMIAGSQLRDTQGEMLSVEGADISELQAGRGRLNDNHGKGFFNAIGRITGAKKVFKAEDATTDREKYYWEKVKAPFIFVKGYLYDDEDHPNARAAAAILRNIHKADTPLQLKASVEGGVVARGISDPSLLARTKIHSVALTFTPANNNTLVEPTSMKKSQHDEAHDMLLIKSVLHLAETNVPSFRHIARDASATKVQHNLVKLVELMKDLGIEGDITIPSKKQILEKALKQKIHSNLEQIREQVVTLKQDELEKAGIKNAIAAAGMGAAMAMAPSATNVASDTASQPAAQAAVAKPTHESMYADVAKKYPLLGAIGAVESQGGKNLKHPTMNGETLDKFYGIGGGKGKSMHEGMTAGGAYGMMPLSAAFAIQKDTELAKKYPKLVEAAKDVKKNHMAFTDALNSDPQADADFAESLFNRNKGKTRSDEQLAYSWLHGLKGSWNQYKHGGKNSFKENKYVKDVLAQYAKQHPQNIERKPALSKAMTAGYGGGGSPTSLSGGGVMQAESLDQGRPSLKYISCDNCGKEQVHAKHQVKCRECGHGMSFEKLYSAIKGNKK